MKAKEDINKDNSFWIRLRSSIILMVITIAAMLTGGYVLWLVLLAVSIIGLTELYKAVSVDKKFIAFAGYLAAAAWYLLLLKDFVNNGVFYDGIIATNAIVPEYEAMSLMPVLVAAFLLILLAVYVLGFPKFNSEQTFTVFFGLFYVAVTLSYIFMTRSLPMGNCLVWLIFLGSWGADTSAYMVGRKIGRHKIVPVLSPKKSLEGFIGGVIGATLLGVAYALIFKAKLTAVMSAPVLKFAIITAVSSVVSMIGDLAASAVKRDKQIKDYGRLIPGHGGILDRFDSVIFIAPIVYYLLIFMK